MFRFDDMGKVEKSGLALMPIDQNNAMYNKNNNNNNNNNNNKKTKKKNNIMKESK